MIEKMDKDAERLTALILAAEVCREQSIKEEYQREKRAALRCYEGILSLIEEEPLDIEKLFGIIKAVLDRKMDTKKEGE